MQKMAILKSIYRKFRDEQGNAMIEAAFILPLFLYLTFAAMEFALIFFFSFVLESAMYDTSRFSKISPYREAQVQMIRDLMSQRSFGLLPVEEVIITTDMQVNVAENWQNAEPEKCFGGGVCPCPGEHFDLNNNLLCDIGPPALELEAPGSLVSFTAFYKKPIYTPFMGFLANTPEGRFAIISKTVIRNEPGGDAGG